MKRVRRINGRSAATTEAAKVKRKMGRGTAAFGTLMCQLRGPLADSSNLHRVLAKLARSFNAEALMSFSVCLR
ncbi:hypothetical protein ACFX15_018675 [Malus domestica]